MCQLNHGGTRVGRINGGGRGNPPFLFFIASFIIPFSTLVVQYQLAIKVGNASGSKYDE